MDFPIERLQMLEQFDKPAFFADQESILASNANAKAVGIYEGAKLSELFAAESSDSSQQLFTARLQGIEYTVSAAQVGNIKLYTLTVSELTQQLQGIMRAAQQLRIPLSGLTSSFDLLKQKKSDQLNTIDKHLHALRRAVRNMSDASLFLEDRSSKKETVEIASYFAETAQKLQQHFTDSKICISYSVFEEKLYCNADIALIERALYNMVSNSLKAGSRNLQLELKKKNKTLYLTVTDDGCGMTDEQKADILTKFREQPSWAFQNYGLGLGMMIVYAAAKAHKGTLLISDNDPHGCRITLTITIEKCESVLRQKPVSIYVDPLGGADPLLLELSDVLPSEDYL